MMRTPSRSYFICTTPRSGSTLLSEAARSTGLAGRPREYFQELPSTLRPATPRDYVGLVPDPIPREVLSAPGADRHADSSEWPSRFATWGDYLGWVVEEGTTPSGVFAAKVMWRYFGGLLLRLREVFGPAADLELLERAFGRPSFVVLRRSDKIGQAVSLWRAIQTWSWRADDGSRWNGPLVYSFAALDHLVRRLEMDEADWGRWFRSVGIEPYEIEYQELVADYAAATRGMLRFLGVGAEMQLDREPPLRRQSDEISDEWVERYRSDLLRQREQPSPAHMALG